MFLKDFKVPKVAVCPSVSSQALTDCYGVESWLVVGDLFNNHEVSRSDKECPECEG